MRASSKRALRIGVAIGALSLLVGVASAAPPSTGGATVSKETREKMATIHEQMAACLRSDKSLAECHSEMRKSCTDLGDQGCPMMGMGGMGMHHPTRQPQSAESPPKK